MSQQEQYLNVIDRDEAEARFQHALTLAPLGEELVPLTAALERVLAHDIVSATDVPSFDRSNYDGFALRAADSFGADEYAPRELDLHDELIASGVRPELQINHGEAAAIATGGMIPRGADAVIPVEHTDVVSGRLVVRKAVTPGFGVAFAGTDISAGETVLRAGTSLTSRETGVLAAIGTALVPVWRRPLVAILSTGDELISPGTPMEPPLVYDSNLQIVSDAVRELGGLPRSLGIVGDNEDALRQKIQEALDAADVVLLSGGTSKGEGDLCYRVVADMNDPGIIVHGVALKPGKPICLAASRGKPVVILPGFPTSAVFTFHEFVAPIIRKLGGLRAESRETIDATMAVKVRSEIGRTEYLLVGLVSADGGLAAYPMGKGSGSVTAFSWADGFVTIGRHVEIVAAGTNVSVQRLGRRLEVADLIVIGSHCVGLDYLLAEVQRRSFRTKLLAVGSSAGLEAAKRGQCDIAGIHLLDQATGEYNRPFVTDGLKLLPGYARQQGIVFRRGDERFANRSVEEMIAQAADDPGCVMVNRNQGSGTRILMDQLLAGRQPTGYAVQPRNHNAVAAAVKQGRADWGLAIESVARASGLGFAPYRLEHFDFVIPKSRRDRPAVIAFAALLEDPATIEHLRSLNLVRQK